MQKKSSRQVLPVLMLLASAVFINCSQKATLLNAESVTLCSQEPNNPDCVNTGGASVDVITSDLFLLQPGVHASAASFGVVDPVGTTLLQDFDGDGLINTKESINGSMFSNSWVADYPAIDTSVAPPVSMRVEILHTTTGAQDQIISNIASTDFESRKNRGSERFHRNELAKKTVKVGTNTKQSNWSVKAGGGFLGITAEAGGGGSSTSVRNAYATRPFRNNLDRRSTTVKSNSAESKAREYRSEKKAKKSAGFKTNPDGGYVRAALYIQNHSINMPVRISNVLCSLLFESAEGELLPVQSFRLRNPDYSVFSAEIYGASEFGPYVIELTGLNAFEIENAIAKGYTPKIYIVDYEMTHVADSNYRAALSSSFTGNNLKIIEENAKGRTSLIKLIGPYMREMARVSAFTVDGEDPADACAVPAAPAWVSPGVSLKRALQRMACSGMSIEYDHYVMDFTGTEFESTHGKFYYEGVKSLNGIVNNVPCESYVWGTSYDGNNVKACVIKPENLDGSFVPFLAQWMVFANGRYFDLLKKATDGAGNVRYFDGANTIPIVEGLNSTIWAGDNYDLTYLSMADLFNEQNDFGTNPIETQEVVQINTKWTNDTLGPAPFHPSSNSKYLGKVGVGDQVEIEVDLLSTNYLNPGFGLPVNGGTYDLYKNFTYNLQPDLINSFTHENGMDIQVNFGLGGAKENWYSISRTAGAAHVADTNTISSVPGDCGQSWDYVAQKFILCFEVPFDLPGVGFDGMVNMYIRTTPNNAYREVVWPEDYRKVKKFKAQVSKEAPVGLSFIEVQNGTGDLGLGVIEQSAPVTIGTTSYAITSVSLDERVYRIALQAGAANAYAPGDTVTVGAFSGKIKNPANIGETSISVIPDTAADALASGQSENGNAITIKGDANTISNVNLLSNVHTINLAAPLGESHAAGEEVFIDAGLSGPLVQIKQDTTFVADWNADPAHAGSGVAVPEDANWLYSAAPGGCSYGLDSLFLLSPACQGYALSSSLANWVGSAAFENGYNDASLYNTYLTQSLNPFVRNPGGSSLDVETVSNTHIVLNEAHKNAALAPASFVHGDQTIVVWQSFEGVDHDIRGRVVDTSTGKTISGEFVVNEVTAGEQSAPRVFAFETNALVVWNSAGELKARRLDLTQNPPVVAAEAEFAVSTGATAGLSELKMDGDMVLAVWRQTVLNVTARLLSISGTQTGTGYDAPVNVFSNGTYAITHIGADLRNGYAVITWSRGTTAGREVDASSYSVAPFAVQWSNVRFSVQDPTNQDNPEAIIVGDEVWIAYRDKYLDGGDVRLRSAHLVTGVKSAITNITSRKSSTQYWPEFVISEKYVVLSWGSAYSGGVNKRVGRVYNRQTSTWGAEFDFLANSPSVAMPQGMKIFGDHVLVYGNPSGMTEWYGQMIDLVTEAPVDQSEFIIHPQENTCSMSANEGLTQMFFCAEFDGFSKTDIAGQKMLVSPSTPVGLQYGLNNFFTAPLIERSYAVKTRLRY